MVDIWSAGNYGEEEESTMRLARPLVFLRTDPTDNGYAPLAHLSRRNTWRRAVGSRRPRHTHGAFGRGWPI
eukprot:5055450-Pyramimonas_sp.AAC.1